MKNKKFLIPAAILILSVIILGINYFNNYQIEKQISELSLENIGINNNIIDMNSLTLKQKIAQMIVVRGDEKDLDFNRLNVGGIFLDRQKKQEDYEELITEYQDSAKIKLFVATDLEGAWTPFDNSNPDLIFPKFSEIDSVGEAGEIGFKHGQALKETGFNINFAPVAEYTDIAYGGRVFSGPKEEIEEKIKAYINMLQANVLGTCKHYPGKAMIRNMHYFSDEQIITQEDLDLFEVCLENNISSIMVSHQIAKGILDSKEKPSSVSPEVISSIDNNVLIIADEINMQSLKKFYPNKIKLYADLINSGENLILDFELDSVDLYELVQKIEEEVKKGDINEKQIDESVKKILETKGYILE